MWKLAIILATLTISFSNAELDENTIKDIVRRYRPNFESSTDLVSDIENMLAYVRERQQQLQRFKAQNDSCIPSNLRLRRLCEEGGQCTAPRQLLTDLNWTSQRSFEGTFKELCPILFFQSHFCESKPPPSQKSPPHKKPEQLQVWLYGLLSVSVISACSLTGLAVVPLLTRQLFHAMMNMFQGLAVGSLCGSAVFHLIPQAFDLTDQDGHLWKALIVFIGIYFFYISERLMKIFADRRKEEKKKINLNTISEEGGGLVGAHHGHSHGPTKDGSIASVAWLIIFGDGMHNFIDGLSLGAAFNNSILGGISISVAVICEEFPHELGDFAVLLGAGMSARQAVLYNFLSALTCFLGLAVGILVGDLTEGTPAIFAFAGGMFLYISLVGMMGEINESLERVTGFGAQLKTLLLQNVGIIGGVVTMFVMAKYAGGIDFESLSLTAEDEAIGAAVLSNIHRDGKNIGIAGL